MKHLIIILTVFLYIGSNAGAENDTKNPADKIAAADDSCSKEIKGALGDLGEITSHLEGKLYIPEETLEIIRKDMGYKKADINKFIEALKMIQKNHIALFEQLLEFYEAAKVYKKDKVGYYKSLCDNIANKKKETLGISHAKIIGREIIVQAKRQEKIDDMKKRVAKINNETEAAKKMKSNTLWNKVFNTATEGINKVLENKRKLEQQRMLEAEAQNDQYRIRSLAISQANVERDKILNRHGLFSPKRVYKKSIKRLVDARNELAGHVNSYKEQMNKYIDEAKRLQRLMAMGGNKAAALKKEAMAQLEAQAKDAKKSVKDMEIKIKSLKAQKNPDLAEEIGLLEADLDAAQADLNELTSEKGKQQMEAQIDKKVAEFIANEPDYQAQIAANERMAFAARVKADVLSEGLQDLDSWIADRREEEEYDVEKEKDYRERVDRGYYYPAATDNRLLPINRRVNTTVRRSSVRRAISRKR